MIRALFFILGLSAAFSLQAQGTTEEIGKAAFYADKLDGRPTASGKPYDKTALTCAHKTYPFGTALRITRIDNNMSVVVTVTDRGPYHDGFVVDLSRKAAEALDMVKDGVARVKVEPANAPASGSTGAVAPKIAAPVRDAAPMTGNVQLIKGYTPESAPATASVAKAPVTTTAKGVSTKAPEAAPLTAPVTKTLVAATPRKTSPAPTVTAKSVPTAAPVQTPLKTSKAAEPVPQQVKPDKVRDLYQISLKKPVKDGFAVQLAVLSNVNTCMQEAAKAEEKWPGKVMMLVETSDASGANPLYKIMLGTYADRKAADAAQSDVMKKGYRKAFIVDLHDQ